MMCEDLSYNAANGGKHASGLCDLTGLSLVGKLISKAAVFVA